MEERSRELTVVGVFPSTVRRGLPSLLLDAAVPANGARYSYIPKAKICWSQEASGDRNLGGDRGLGSGPGSGTKVGVNGTGLGGLADLFSPIRHSRVLIDDVELIEAESESRLQSDRTSLSPLAGDDVSFGGEACNPDFHPHSAVADPPASLSDNIDADTDIKTSGNVIDLISDNESSEDDEAGHFEHSAVAVPVEVVDTIDDSSDDTSTAPAGELEVEPKPEAETDIEVQPLLPQYEAPIELEAESVHVDRATSLLRDLTAEDTTVAQNAINGVGRPDEVLASSDTDSVQRKSLHTLQPGVLLNDEVIHYFLCRILAKRDAALAAKFHGRKRNHFFKSYMTTKLLDGPGGYNYSNVQRWSRKVPGKDIFALDKIFFPGKVAICFIGDHLFTYCGVASWHSLPLFFVYP